MPGGRRQAGGHPPVGVDQVGTGRDLVPGSCPQSPPQACQGNPSDGAPQGRSDGVGAARCVSRMKRPARTRMHRNPVHHHLPRFVAGRDHADGDSPAHESAGERAERGAGGVAWPAGVVVGQEDDPHRSVPDVELLEPSEIAGDLPRLLAHPGDDLAQKAESEQDDAADHHHLDQIQQRP